MHKQLIFEIDRKLILNANSAKHYMAESKMAGQLRAIAATEGLKHHPHPELAEQKFAEIVETAKKTLAKSRATKLLKKKKASIEEISEKLEEIENSFDISNTIVQPMFNKFKLVLTVCPPTRRKLDPPNLYPTLKPLVDGLTDASWWDDDEFTHMLEVSFRYGGLSGEKDTFIFILDITELTEEESSQYIQESENILKIIN